MKKQIKRQIPIKRRIVRRIIVRQQPIQKGIGQEVVDMLI